MWEMNQKTLKNSVKFSGIGLHSGVRVNVKLEPADGDHGIIFIRTDLKNNQKVVANFKNVTSAKLCTKIENKFGTSVSTIEHLMAAFYICGVDNVVVSLDGPEVPIMDGSAKDFVKFINEVGLRDLNEKRKFLKIVKKCEFQEDGKSISIEPIENTFSVSFTLSYQDLFIKTQSNSVNFSGSDLEEIYTARTFCLYEDIEKIKAIGLAKGGSLENAIVVQGEKVLNKEGLRCEKEFVNHKILDLAGDFMLSGMRVIGSINCIHGGHSLTNKFLRKIIQEKDTFVVIEGKSHSINIRKVHPVQKRLVVNA